MAMRVVGAGLGRTAAIPGDAVGWSALLDGYDAVVLLSTRTDAHTSFASGQSTIFEMTGKVRAADPGPMADWLTRVDAVCARHGMTWGDRAWGPLCSALGVAVPDEPFPHANATDELRATVGLA